MPSNIDMTCRGAIDFFKNDYNYWKTNTIYHPQELKDGRKILPKNGSPENIKKTIEVVSEILKNSSMKDGCYKLAKKFNSSEDAKKFAGEAYQNSDFMRALEQYRNALTQIWANSDPLYISWIFSQYYNLVCKSKPRLDTKITEFYAACTTIIEFFGQAYFDLKGRV